MEIDKIVIAVGVVVSAVVGLLVTGDFNIDSIVGEVTNFIENSVGDVISEKGKELLNELAVN